MGETPEAGPLPTPDLPCDASGGKLYTIAFDDGPVVYACGPGGRFLCTSKNVRTMDDARRVAWEHYDRCVAQERGRHQTEVDSLTGLAGQYLADLTTAREEVADLRSQVEQLTRERDERTPDAAEPLVYYDIDGNEVDLPTLCVREPAWEASRIVAERELRKDADRRVEAWREKCDRLRGEREAAEVAREKAEAEWQMARRDEKNYSEMHGEAERECVALRERAETAERTLDELRLSTPNPGDTA